MKHPGATAGFIVAFTFLVLAVGITAYVLIRRRRTIIHGGWNTSRREVHHTINLGKEQLLDEPRSYTQSWAGSSVAGNGLNSLHHLPSPDKPVSETGVHTSATNHIIKGNGKLQFTVAYDNNIQELQVSILRCVELPQIDSSLNTVDSYVKLELLPEKRHRVKTRVVRGSSNPFYGEVFTMDKVPLSLLKAGSLHFIVVGFDRHSRDSVIGEVVCTLGDLELNLVKEVTVTRDILRRKFSVSRMPYYHHHRHLQKLQIAIINAVKPSDKNRGMLLLSLCYLPAASRLTAVVLKAEGLPKVDLANSSGNPYVKLYFMENDRRIAKKKTHVKKRTSNPVFNEAFALEIPPNAKLEDIRLEFRLVNWERDSPSRVIGRVTIGCRGNDKAKEHWSKAIENPRKQVAEWHTILV
ncbi:unnamed protein product [Hydatigera taeniaeformis]|uniref:Synaptotagmin-11 n=1 Tax=Hydatigena taeniaeformis TaxID=6205 RepID=A0A0R3X610_HYDTA|nr:unnamed protein product [Hydatigera taeniaeformis]